MYFLAPAGGLCLFLPFFYHFLFFPRSKNAGAWVHVFFSAGGRPVPLPPWRGYWGVCLSVCVCVYTFIFWNVHVHKHKHKHTHTHTHTQGPTLMKKQDYIKPLESPLMFICAASLGVGVQVKKKAPHNFHVWRWALRGCTGQNSEKY